MTRPLAILAATLLLGAALAGAANALGVGQPPARFLVGYDPSEATVAALAIQAAGGSIERSSDEIGFAVVSTDNRDAFLLAAENSPFIDYVENDDVTRIAGGQWNGAQWNGAQWNGGQWNGGQWNGGQWNGGQWNGGQWNSWSGAQQNATLWSRDHYDPPAGWRYDVASSDPGLVWQWGLWATEGVGLAETSGGSSICVLDSGVAWDHPDIAPNYAEGYNAIDPLASAYDDGGHGTHIAGIAAGAHGNAFGIAGVANVDILNAKVLTGEGTGTESDLAFGLLWCANQDAEVAVMALSVTEVEHPTLLRAIEYAAARDVLLLASAGNDAGAVAFPASHPLVVGVSAVDGDLALAPFSNTGSEVDLAAPGVHVLGPLPGGAFAFGSGTSQSVAFAAGGAALVRDAAPAIEADRAREILLASASDLGASGPDTLYGEGLLDLEAALLAAS